MAGVSEKFRRIFSKHSILSHFRTCNTLREKLVHPKEKTPRHKLNNAVYAVRSAPTLYWGDNLSTKAWFNTGEPAALARTQQSTYT